MARADGSANRPPLGARTVTVESRGTYAKSVTRLNTERRPVSVTRSSSQVTSQPPDSGSTSISSSPVTNWARDPIARFRTRRPL
jgi:hypothetical protein